LLDLIVGKLLGGLAGAQGVEMAPHQKDAVLCAGRDEAHGTLAAEEGPAVWRAQPSEVLATPAFHNSATAHNQTLAL
jgi:hypothetical protein